MRLNFQKCNIVVALGLSSPRLTIRVYKHISRYPYRKMHVLLFLSHTGIIVLNLDDISDLYSYNHR